MPPVTIKPGLLSQTPSQSHHNSITINGRTTGRKGHYQAHRACRVRIRLRMAGITCQPRRQRQQKKYYTARRSHGFAFDESHGHGTGERPRAPLPSGFKSVALRHLLPDAFAGCRFPDHHSSHKHRVSLCQALLVYQRHTARLT